MKIAIRKEPNGIIYIDKNLRDKIDYTLPPYNFTIIEIEEQYKDCINEDFNDNLTFSVDKYNARQLEMGKQARIGEIRIRLNELSQDFVQADLGAVFADIEERKAEFKALHNELRELLGKEPRLYQ